MELVNATSRSVASVANLSITPVDKHIQAYNRYLRDLIIAGKAKPSIVVSHNVALDDVAEAYDKFDKRIDGYTKVLLHP